MGLGRRKGLLLGAGVLSEVVYLAVTVRLPWWRYGGTLNNWSRVLGQGWEVLAACLIGIGVLVAAYLLGWYAIRGESGARGIVWGFAILFAVTLFWLMPITSDLFTYLSQSHLFTDLGANPLVTAALEFKEDPLVRAYPAFYAGHPSVYGPAWTLLSVPGTLGRYDVAGGLFYLKGVAVGAFLGCAWLLERILRRIRPTAVVEGLCLFAWNPLVLLLAVGDGHNDIVLMALVLLAFWLLLHERWVLAFGTLALSVWIKYVSVIFFPLSVIYVWRRFAGQEKQRRVVLGWGALMAVGVSALVFVPFWRLEWVVHGVERLLRPVNWHGNVTELPAWALGVGLLLFVVAFFALGHQFIRGENLFRRLMDFSFLVSLLAFLLGAARSQPWHLIWLATLAGLTERRWAWPVVIALSALMLVVQVWVEWGAPGVGISF